MEALRDFRISNIEEETKEQTKEQEAYVEQQRGAEKEKDKGQRGKFTNPRTLETSSVSSGAGIELAWCPAW